MNIVTRLGEKWIGRLRHKEGSILVLLIIFCTGLYLAKNLGRVDEPVRLDHTPLAQMNAMMRHQGESKPWKLEVRGANDEKFFDLGSEVSMYWSFPINGTGMAVLAHEWPRMRPVLIIVENRMTAPIYCHFDNLTDDFRWGIRTTGDSRPPFIVVYDTRKRRFVSIPALWKDGAACPELEQKASQILKLAGGSQIDMLAPARIIGGHWYFSGGSEVIKYNKSTRKWKSILNLEAYKIHSLYESQKTPYLLLHKTQSNAKHSVSDRSSGWARLSLSRGARIESLPFVPAFLMRKTGSIKALTNKDELLKMLLNSLEEIEPAGVWDFGNTNSEGRISWRQMYVTQLYLDFIEFPQYFEPLRKTDNRTFSTIKRRLKLEWDNFLDIQCSRDLNNYTTPRYSLDRQPFHGVVNIGRLAEILGRYEVVTQTKLPQGCWDPLIPRLMTLEGTWDEIHKSKKRYAAFVPEGTVFLRRRRKVEFARDGNNLPFNHVSAWITGLIWAEKAGRIKITDDLRTAIHDQWHLFHTFSGVPNSGQDQFSWNYTWGPSYNGWTPKDDISSNSPTFGGSRYIAGLGYLMMDSQALFETQRRFPNEFVSEFNNFKSLFENAFKTGELGLFGFRHLADWQRMSLDLQLPPASSLLSLLRPTGMHEVRGAFWAAATWVKNGYDDALFHADGGFAPYLRDDVERYVIEPGSVMLGKDLIGDEESRAIYSSEDQIEVYDAHCGRGFFELSGVRLSDRQSKVFKLNKISEFSFVAAPENNRYDELRIRLKNKYGTSPWRKIIIVAKGNQRDDLEDRFNKNWKQVRNDCANLVK